MEASTIELVDIPTDGDSSCKDRVLLSLEDVTLQTPNGAMTLIDSLSLQVRLQHRRTVCIKALAFADVLGGFPGAIWGIIADHWAERHWQDLLDASDCWVVVERLWQDY